MAFSDTRGQITTENALMAGIVVAATVAELAVATPSSARSS